MWSSLDVITCKFFENNIATAWPTLGDREKAIKVSNIAPAGFVYIKHN